MNLLTAPPVDGDHGGAEASGEVGSSNNATAVDGTQTRATLLLTTEADMLAGPT